MMIYGSPWCWTQDVHDVEADWGAGETAPAIGALARPRWRDRGTLSHNKGNEGSQPEGDEGNEGNEGNEEVICLTDLTSASDIW